MTISHAPTLLSRATPAGAGSPVVDGWTADAMDRYVAALPGVGRTLLGTILAVSPCPTEAAQGASGLDGSQYADAHACLEEALFVVPEVARLPFDVVDGCFTVDGGVAALMLRSLARL